jgi:hypothetical protein
MNLGCHTALSKPLRHAKVFAWKGSCSLLFFICVQTRAHIPYLLLPPHLSADMRGEPYIMGLEEKIPQYLCACLLLALTTPYLISGLWDLCTALAFSHFFSIQQSIYFLKKLDQLLLLLFQMIIGFSFTYTDMRTVMLHSHFIHTCCI